MSSACGPSEARSRRASARGGGAPRAVINADRSSRNQRESPGQAGFGLVEVLLSTLIASALLCVLMRLAVTAQDVTRTQTDAADLQQRLRVATDAIYSDLVMAGAGPSDGLWQAGLVSVLAPLVPARTGERGADPELSHYSDRISILYVPEPSAHTVLRVGMAGADAPLVVDGDAPGCASRDTCGFERGDRALVLDADGVEQSYDIFTVSDAQAGLLDHQGALSKAYVAGSRVVRVVQRVYYLARGAGRLMVYDGWSSDLPLADHVVDLRFTYYADLGGPVLTALSPGQMTDGPVGGTSPNRFDRDLLRIRRVRVSLRLETESSSLRAGGPLFIVPGTSAGGTRLVPDQQITFDVAPENLNLSR